MRAKKPILLAVSILFLGLMVLVLVTPGPTPSQAQAPIDAAALPSLPSITLPTIPVLFYHLTTDVPGGHGSIGLDPAGGNYLPNTVVKLTATPDIPLLYHFVSWGGDASGSNNPYFMLMNSNKTVTATFAPNLLPLYRHLTLSVPGGGGSIQASPPGPDYLTGAPVTLTPVSQPGYIFVSWGGDVSGNSYPLVLTMNTNKTVTATFVPDPTIDHTITASAGAGGSISPSGNVIVTGGDDQTFIITADPGYHVAGVLVDSVSVGAVTSYEFEDVTANHTISATFAPNPDHTITASAGAGGTISPSGAVSVADGSDQTFTITADPGYHVVDVRVDGVSVGAVTSYAFTNVTANHTISATFAPSGGCVSGFPDVPGTHPYCEAIADLANRGIIDGYTNGYFGPNDPVRRQQFAKMVTGAGGYPVSEADVCHFTDVETSDATTLYPDNFIAVCAAKGITVGKTATTFDPYSYITRYQVISMVVRAADDLDPGLLATPPSGYGTWRADPTHGANAARAEYGGLLAGLDLTTLNPYGNMPRGEVAQVLHNLIQLLLTATGGS